MTDKVFARSPAAEPVFHPIRGRFYFHDRRLYRRLPDAGGSSAHERTAIGLLTQSCRVPQVRRANSDCQFRCRIAREAVRVGSGTLELHVIR
jgi:hypothetical protein